MAGNERSRLEAELSVLERATERARAEVERLTELVSTLKASVSKSRQSIARLESRGPRIVTLTEYRKMRVEATQLAKELTTVESDLRRKSRNLERLRQEVLSLRRPKSP